LIVVFTASSSVRVNTVTTDEQRAQQITRLADGGWVVTWQSAMQETGSDGASTGVYQQRYDADGKAVGGEVHVNSYTPSSQYAPKITALENGGWVVAWNSNAQDGSATGVYQQVFDAEGDRSGGETQINTVTNFAQQDPLPIGLEDGRFVTLWLVQEADGTPFGTFRIYQRLFEPDGDAITGEIEVGAPITGNLSEPRAVALKDGGWVVTWSTEGSGTTVYQQVFSSTGGVVRATEQVNTHDPLNQFDPSVTALDSGGWVITWTSYGQDGADTGIYQQAYTETGTRLGLETKVNTTEPAALQSSSVVPLKNGGWVVVWQSSDNTNRSVYTQAFDADGNAIGDETAVSTPARPIPQQTITALEGGGWVVVWNGVDGTDTDGDYTSDSTGVFLQIFNEDGSKDGGVRRVNSSTSGSQALDSSVGRNQDKVIALDDGGFVITWTSTSVDGENVDVYQRAYHPGTLAPEGITGTLTFTEGKTGTVGTLRAVDDDSDTGFIWSLVDDAGGRFRIDEETGKVTVANAVRLDYEQAKTHTVTVKVTDADGNSFTKTLTANGIDVANEDLTGSSRADKLWGGSKADTFRGADGDDSLRGGGGKDVLDGGDGADLADYSDKLSRVEVKLNDEHSVTVRVDGASEDLIRNIENLLGGTASDKFTGDANGNSLSGRSGNDTLVGGDGKDILTGGSGKDTLSGHNDRSTSDDGDCDLFVYTAASESGLSSATQDVVWGTFTHGSSRGDLIDLSAIDANGSASGNGTFRFIGTDSFHTNSTGEVQVRATENTHEYLVKIDTDTDSGSEMTILVHSNSALTASDFIL
jgi:hypothetical protein